jgi:hypothetical protein
MAIHFRTNRPQWLLEAFDARIAQSEPAGKITTWERSKNGKYFTHKAEQWRAKAWLRPHIQEDALTFYIIKPKDAKVTQTVYAYYHGHLVETFLTHFDKLFVTAECSALAESDDNC